MLEKEFWSKDIVDIVTDEYVDELAFDIRTKKPAMCSVIGCKNCLFGRGDDVCSEKRNKWANSEHVEPAKLTLAEKVVLENLDKNFKWIAREKDGRLFCYEYKPHKLENDNMWIIDYGNFSCFPFDKLFEFIKWEDDQPNNITNILSDCELINDD